MKIKKPSLKPAKVDRVSSPGRSSTSMDDLSSRVKVLELGGGGGGVTGGANVGSDGVGPYDSRLGSNLQFRNIAANSDKVSIGLDVPNKNITVDVVESELNVRNLKNVSPGTNGSFAAWSDTGGLASVPGYSFDDIGSLRVGAQNSITIPSLVTDYFSVGISPTVSNAGLINLSGVQLNSPINVPVVNYNGFSVNGYGPSVALNYKAFNSDVNYSGVGTSATHFRATSPWSVTGAMTGFSFYAAGNAGSFQGAEITATGTYSSMSGLKIDLSSATSTDRKLGIELSEGSLGAFFTFSTVSNLPTLVDSGNIVRPVFEVKSGAARNGTDVIMNNFAGLMDIKDDMGYSALGLGAVSVGFVSQVAVASGKVMQTASMCLGALAIDSTSTGGTITEAQLFNANALTFGGSLTITNLYGFRLQDGASTNAVNTWGVCIDDTGAENFLGKSLLIGTNGTRAVTNSDVALEIGGAKAMRVGRVTTTERTSMTNVSGLFVFDTTLSKLFYNTGSGWVQI